MIIVLSSPKPGTGTSTTAALLALALSSTTRTHLVDLCGDQPAILGIVAQPGSSTELVGHLCLHQLADPTAERGAMIGRLAQTGHVIVDAGYADHPIHDQLPTGADRCWVLRPCYLALRKAATIAHRPDHVIMLNEPGRALNHLDIEAVTGVPVIATIEVNPHIARCIDAGLLTTNAPRATLATLAAIADHAKAA